MINKIKNPTAVHLNIIPNVPLNISYPPNERSAYQTVINTKNKDITKMEGVLCLQPVKNVSTARIAQRKTYAFCRKSVKFIIPIF